VAVSLVPSLVVFLRKHRGGVVIVWRVLLLSSRFSWLIVEEECFFFSIIDGGRTCSTMG
jgi:hypothetical protein